MPNVIVMLALVVVVVVVVHSYNPSDREGETGKSLGLDSQFIYPGGRTWFRLVREPFSNKKKNGVNDIYILC